MLAESGGGSEPPLFVKTIGVADAKLLSGHVTVEPEKETGELVPVEFMMNSIPSGLGVATLQSVSPDVEEADSYAASKPH